MRSPRLPALLTAAALLLTLLPSCAPKESGAPGADAPLRGELPTGARVISLAASEGPGGWTHAATVDGESVPAYDYVWHADPSAVHDAVKDAPAEYYTGTEPGDEAVYIAHDVFYCPALPAGSFVKQTYDGEQEWCSYYTDGVNDGYIFASLPVLGEEVPTQMTHTPEEAYENAVLHITQPGTYALEGAWHGQIWIDLGPDAAADPAAVVTLLLNGADVTCTVAPALVFYRVYECDQAWLAYDSGENEAYAPSQTVDTSGAGANVVLADGAVNNFTGSNVFRMMKTTYKKGQENAAVPVQKKLRKLDGAFYSYCSMNIGGQSAGTGVLNITAGFEGLDTEQHLTINGGSVNIFSQDDGVNVNEDGVSVVTVNGGSLHILAGLGHEGDGIDSNGYLVINGGTVVSMASPRSDSGLDSDAGSYVNGGTVVALGSTMDWAEGDGSGGSGQAAMNLQFSDYQSSDEALIVTDAAGAVVFAYDPDKDEVAGANIRQYRGAILSFPALAVGETYHIYVGGDVSGSETAGVYDPATVTGFSAEARQQSYSGSFQTGRPGMGGGFGPGGFDPGEPPEGFDPEGPPEGFDPGQGRGDRDGPAFGRPGGQTPPEGFDGQTPPEPPDGQMPPGGPGGGRDLGPGEDDPAGRTTQFYMEGRVNNFSRVSDPPPPDPQKSSTAPPYCFFVALRPTWGYAETPHAVPTFWNGS